MRFLEWWLHTQLNAKGEIYRRGILRGRYVNPIAADIRIVEGMKVLIGLGAGRPEVAAAMIADTFSGNPWTDESTAKLIEGLEQAHEIVRSVGTHTDLSANAFWGGRQSLASYHPAHMSLSRLFDDRLGMIRAMAACRAAYWGLTSEYQAEEFLVEDINRPHRRLRYNSLDHFYEWCDGVVNEFNETVGPLRPIPPQLRVAPEIARRLSA